MKEEASKVVATARTSRRGIRPNASGVKEKAVKQVAAMTGSSPATVYRNTSNGSHPKPKKSQKPAPSVKYEDSVEMLIELARLDGGSIRVRLYDYVISVTYSPKDKLLPAVKTLSVEPCGTSK